MQTAFLKTSLLHKYLSISHIIFKRIKSNAIYNLCRNKKNKIKINRNLLQRVLIQAC